MWSILLPSCISFDSYIKPQPQPRRLLLSFRCISFDSYIKPQRASQIKSRARVVYLLIPTSNHNLNLGGAFCLRVVYLLIPTSNHNHIRIKNRCALLYIFWFLHQTTTGRDRTRESRSCISFDSYIKPQRLILQVTGFIVVYLLIPTSNHN